MADDDKDKQDPPENEPKYLTEEQFGELFNKAFTAKWRATEKQLQSSQEKLQEAMLAKLDERLSKTGDDPPPAGDPPAKPDDKAAAEFQKQLQSLAEQLEKEKAARKQADEARIETERQRQFDSARQQLREGLKDKAHPDYLDDWIDRLTVVEKRMTVAEDGSVTLKVKHAPYKGSPEQEEDLPLDQALPILVARPEQKKYQAPPAAADPKSQSRAPASTAQRAAQLKSDNPLDRAEARLAELGMTLDEALSSST